MAVRGWGRSAATAVGMAAGTGAAQLGLGYGLGVVAWLPDGADGAWPTSLVWATWIAATSVIIGAICAGRLAPASATGDPTADAAPATFTTHLWRLAASLAAGLGALLTVALVAVPARTAAGTGIPAPQVTAAGYALAGVVLGLVVAYWALSSRAAAANVIATTSWLWLLAVVAVVHAVASGRTSTDAQLGIWQVAWPRRFWFGDQLHWPTTALSVTVALVIGVLVARPYARHPGLRVGAAVSGVAGPLLVAGVYLLATPRLADEAAAQMSAAYLAPYAALAGLAGSVAAAVRAQRAEARARLARAAVPPAATDPATTDPATTDPVTDPATEAAGGQPAADPDWRPDVTVRLPTQPTRESAPGDPALADDAYAPARAYAADFATGTATAPAGDPPAAAPLWPAETGLSGQPPTPAEDLTQTDPAGEPEKKSRRTGRRSK